jgi:uncharacterized membrane protein YdjX (TVP38/TMEM64 family)
MRDADRQAMSLCVGSREPEPTATSRRHILARLGVGASWIALVVVWEVFDVVNVGCGILHINPKRFLLATIIGSLPATVAFVLLGASLDRVDKGFGGIDKGTLVLSVALIAGSIGVSQIVKRRSAARASR